MAGLSRIDLESVFSLSEQEQDRFFAELEATTTAPVNGELVEAQEVLRGFEQRNSMSSSDMLERLRRGEMTETDEVSQWLFAHGVVGQLQDAAAGQP